MSKPGIICVAITGSVPTKADNPAVPITVEEQVESTHEASQGAGQMRPVNSGKLLVACSAASASCQRPL